MNALRWSEMRGQRLAAVSITAVLLAGCGGTLPSPPPTADLVPAAHASPSPTPPPTPPALSSPAVVDPTVEPPVGATGWVETGLSVPALVNPTIVPLADGGALVVGSEYIEDGGQIPTAYRWVPGAPWEHVEPMNKERTRFGATLLQDGRVLVAGGLNDASQSYSSTYVFDPARPSDGWSKAGLLDAARTAPSLVTLSDGRVLVAGGYFHTGGTASRAPEATLGSRHGTAPWDVTDARRGPTDVDVPPYGYALATAELFDPETGEWTSTGSMNFARAGAPAVTLADGRVLIVGTSDDVLDAVAREAHTTAEIYDPASGTFALAASLPRLDEELFRDLGVDVDAAHMDIGSPGQLVALPDGGALLVGRNHWAKHHADTFESFRFDSTNATWRMSGTPCAGVGYNESAGMRLTPAPCLIGGYVAGLNEGRVLSAGNPGSEFPGDPRSTAIYDSATDTWLEQPPLSADYWRVGATGLTDGTALILAQTFDGPTVALRFIPPP